MNLVKTTLYTSLILGSLWIQDSAADIENPDGENRSARIENLSPQEILVDFRGIAKEAIPTIVSVKVQGMKSTSEANDKESFYEELNSWDLFNFFKKKPRSLPFEGQASGVIVDPKGLILTNSHVIHGMSTIVVQLSDGSEHTAKLLGEDSRCDLALLKINKKGLPYLSLGNSDSLEVGQWVAAIGNPFGLQATFTVGVVSAKGRSHLDIAKYEDFIQTDAAINQGNSGGALITVDGALIGINTAIATTHCSSYVGIGFAIPSNIAKSFIDILLTEGKISHGFLGLYSQSLDLNLANALGLKTAEGVLVSNVSKNSPADKANIQTEDVILRVDNRKIESASQLRELIYTTKPGTQIYITLSRKDHVMTIPVTIEELLDKEISRSIQDVPNNMLGIEVATLTEDAAKKFKIESHERGAIISQVNPTGVGAVAGLKKGAVILAVNRQKISSAEEFHKIIENTTENETLLLQIKQDDSYLFLSLQNGKKD